MHSKVFRVLPIPKPWKSHISVFIAWSDIRKVIDKNNLQSVCNYGFVTDTSWPVPSEFIPRAVGKQTSRFIKTFNFLFSIETLNKFS